MSIKLIPMKCPCCGASMHVFDSDKSTSPPPIECTYCNTQFIVDHGELCKREAPDTAVFYADNRKVIEVSVELPPAKALTPAWMEATYDTVINALKPFGPCAAIPLHATIR